MRILYIFVFLICLSLVVCIHELGHLSTAKIFNVFCYEYSIGFGKEFFKKKLYYKRKKNPLYVAKDGEVIKPCKDPNYELVQSETYFSLRMIPLGGYVSMAGEDNLEFDDKIIPKERSIEGINNFKKIIIFVSGVFFNFVLAFLLFFINFAFTNQLESLASSSNQITVSDLIDNDESLAHKNNIETGDRILSAYQEYHNVTGSSEIIYFPDNKYSKDLDVYLSYKDNTNYLKEDCISYAIQDCFLYKYYSTVDSNNYVCPTPFKDIEPNYNTYRIIHLKIQKNSSNEIKDISFRSNYSLTKINSDDVFKSSLIGLSPFTRTYRNTLNQAFIKSGQTFGSLFTQLYGALFSIFTPRGWTNVGGIISVYRVTANTFTSGNIGNFIFIWGYISLNLGCFNLLPFPGLDGWQTLLALIESISRRKINKKAKGIFNIIGLVLLFAFASVLIVKDIIMMI